MLGLVQLGNCETTEMYGPFASPQWNEMPEGEIKEGTANTKCDGL